MYVNRRDCTIEAIAIGKTLMDSCKLQRALLPYGESCITDKLLFWRYIGDRCSLDDEQCSNKSLIEGISLPSFIESRLIIARSIVMVMRIA